MLERQNANKSYNVQIIDCKPEATDSIYLVVVGGLQPPVPIQ